MEKSKQHKGKKGLQTGKAIQAEAAKTALQAIILFAKLAHAGEIRKCDSDLD